ncbi:MAG: 23S rRNA (pseudouridine(1915)-N(3))-methyltransferase RlmH [Verrucomicrobiaceae bacterium]
MKWNLITVGKPSLTWARSAADDYLARMKRHADVDWKMLREGNEADVTDRMMAASEGSLRVILDEKGQSVSSKGFAQWIGKQQLAGRKRVSILIGGANGHSDVLKAAADETWSLSALTLQHELACVVFLEQLYRAYSILAGSPYHRE